LGVFFLVTPERFIGGSLGLFTPCEEAGRARGVTRLPAVDKHLNQANSVTF